MSNYNHFTKLQLATEIQNSAFGIVEVLASSNIPAYFQQVNGTYGQSASGMQNQGLNIMANPLQLLRLVQELVIKLTVENGVNPEYVQKPYVVGEDEAIDTAVLINLCNHYGLPIPTREQKTPPPSPTIDFMNCPGCFAAECAKVSTGSDVTDLKALWDAVICDVPEELVEQHYFWEILVNNLDLSPTNSAGFKQIIMNGTNVMVDRAIHLWVAQNIPVMATRRPWTKLETVWLKEMDAYILNQIQMKTVVPNEKEA
jgi:hypothetical protein